MTRFLPSLFRSVLCLTAVVLAACQGVETEDALPDTGSVAQALCTATQNCPSGAQISCTGTGTQCVASQDSTGLYVQCDGGAITYCPPACTCGAVKTSFGAAWGATCSDAIRAARTIAEQDSECPGRFCSSSITSQTCTPVSSNRSDGFNVDLQISYQCKEPVNCYP